MLSREKELHDALFPQIAFLSSDYLAAFEPKGLDAVQKAERKWRNAWCDRQMIWAHENSGRDVFVTRDGNYQKRLGADPRFANLAIATPEEALAQIRPAGLRPFVT